MGYQSATLDQVAAAAGFTKGAVYWHFPNKRALFLALVAESVESNIGTLEAFLAAAEADLSSLKQKLGEWIDGIDERESLPAFGAELEIESRRDAEIREIHQRMIVQHEQQLGGFLQRYFEAVGETPALPPMELAKALITAFKGFALARQNRLADPPTSAMMVRHLLGLPVVPNDKGHGAT